MHTIQIWAELGASWEKEGVILQYGSWMLNFESLFTENKTEFVILNFVFKNHIETSRDSANVFPFRVS
jgi:hypothetical protein